MNSQIHKYISFCLDAHSTFVEQVWNLHPLAIQVKVGSTTIRPSYHSQHHIQAVINVVNKLFAQFPEHDPLQISDDLRRWCKENKISNDHRKFIKKNIHRIFVLAFAAHDLGNISQTGSLKNSRVEFTSKFEFEPITTELKSAGLARELLSKYQIFADESEIVNKIVSYLIMQTVFDPMTSFAEKPYWVTVQLIDQILSHFVSDVPSRQASAGYLNELYVAHEHGVRQPISLEKYLNFLPNRFAQLVKNQATQNQMIQIVDPDKKRSEYLEIVKVTDDRPTEYEQDVAMIFQLTNTVHSV